MRVRDQKNFFQNIYLDNDGNMVIVVDSVANPEVKGVSQYNTFKKLYLTAEGYLKTYEG